MSFKRICSFCFSHINNENAGLITNTTKEILDLLLIKLDLGDRSDHAICNVCSERLLAAFEFKSTCKYTDTTIIPYVDWEKPTQLDLWQIYLQERDNKRTVTLSEDEQVCRLCMELTGKMHVPLQDIDKDEFQKFLPEINVNIIKDPVVCKTCFDSFAAHSKFLKKLKNCVDHQEEIKNLGCPRKLNHTDELLAVTMEEVDIKLEDNPSIDSCMQPGPIKLEIEESKQTFIKAEDIETDFEYDRTRIMDHTVLAITTKEVDIKVEDESSMDSCIQLEQIKLEVEECDQLNIKTEFENDVMSAKSLVSEIHPVAIQSKGQTVQTETSIYNCDICDYKTKIKRSIQMHSVVHQDPLKLKQFTCDLCNFRTNHVSSLKCHELVHKDPSQVQMHKCDICTYETKYKAKLKYHQLIHKEPSEVKMFGCDNCGYRAKIKAVLKRHQLKHKDPSEVQMYKCATCDYETKIKSWLIGHLLKHKDPSEVQMHKCDICTYQTKYKAKLKCHELVHKDPSQVPRFSCDDCEYKSKFKAELKKHQLKHKDPSEVQMYKCPTCDYETKFKRLLKSHLLKHKDPWEVPMFKCAKCSYESSRKSNLSRHYKSQHRNPS